MTCIVPLSLHKRTGSGVRGNKTLANPRSVKARRMWSCKTRGSGTEGPRLTLTPSCFRVLRVMHNPSSAYTLACSTYCNLVPGVRCLASSISSLKLLFSVTIKCLTVEEEKEEKKGEHPRKTVVLVRKATRKATDDRPSAAEIELQCRATRAGH